MLSGLNPDPERDRLHKDVGPALPVLRSLDHRRAELALQLVDGRGNLNIHRGTLRVVVRLNSGKPQMGAQVYWILVSNDSARPVGKLFLKYKIWLDKYALRDSSSFDFHEIQSRYGREALPVAHSP